MRPRVLIVQASFNPPGGGNAVASWIVEALRDESDVSALVWVPPDFAAINHAYGTSLRPSDLEVIEVPRWIRRGLDAMPSSLALIRIALLRRSLNRLRRRRAFDVLISGNNEFDFGSRGIQYVHYPYFRLPRPAVDYRWYHRPPGVVPFYRQLAQTLSGVSLARIRANLTLVNSAFIAEQVMRTHGTASRVVYPPVPGSFPEVPWDERDDGIVCVGRFSPEKEIDKVVRIVAGVRGRGREVALHLVTERASGSRYAERIAALARANPEWIQLHENLSREDVVRRMTRHRYGLHGMVGEHFGIGVAELQRAGCIPFAPDHGGPVEILGGDARLLYASEADAIDKLDRVIGDAGLQQSLRADIRERRDRFTTERFVAEIRELVAGFAQPDPASAPPS